MPINPVILSILIGLAAALFPAANTKVNSINQSPPPKCIGGKDGVNADLFKAAQDASNRIVQAYSANKEFDPKDVRLMKASRVACAAADVQHAATELISTNDKMIRKELLEAAREKALKILARYNSSDGDVTFGGPDLRNIETFLVISLAIDCLRMPASSSGNAEGADTRASAKRLIEAFNQSSWDAPLSADDERKVKECRQTFQKN